MIAQDQIKPGITNSVFCCLLIVVILAGCGRQAKEENAQLREMVRNLQQRIEQLQQERDNLKATISELQKTADYYYKMGVSSRHNKQYQDSNNYLNKMIEMFPQNSLVVEAEKLIAENNDDITQSLYNRAITLQRDGKVKMSNAQADILITKFPKSSFAVKAKQLKKDNAAKVKEREETERRRDCDLELIDWNWSSAHGYAEARGQVKNISGKSLKNVAALATFYDKDGGFIKTDSALIEFNPVLDGQVSSFTVMTTHNPAISKASVQFKFLMGGAIPTYRRSP